MISSPNKSQKDSQRDYSKWILAVSLAITLVSIGIIVANLCFDLFSGCPPPGVFQRLSYITVWNALLLVPLAYALKPSSTHELPTGTRSDSTKLKPKIHSNKLLTVLALLPVIIIILAYIGGAIESRISRKIEHDRLADRRMSQESQVAVARQSNMKFELGSPTLSKFSQGNVNSQNEVYDEYLLIVPLTIENIPESLTMYNVDMDCDKILTESGDYLSEDFYNDVVCKGFFKARKINNVWEYTIFQQSPGQFTDKHSISLSLRAKQGQKLPKLKSVPVTLFIPSGEYQVYSNEVQPGALALEQSIVLEKEIELQGLNYPQ